VGIGVELRVNELGNLVVEDMVGFEELGNWRVNDEAEMMSSE
jgi:hypothetical protein